VLTWIHLVATGLYLGSTLGIALFTLPRARKLADLAARRKFVAQVMRLYDPAAIALLGVMVMTGAWSVTGYKAALGEQYYATFGSGLAWKLGFAFLVVMSGTYVCFGLGHRLVRQDEWGEPLEEARLRSMLGRLSGAAWVTVLLTLATVYVAVGREG
jgi:uncharacterized membrane protein